MVHGDGVRAAHDDEVEPWLQRYGCHSGTQTPLHPVARHGIADCASRDHRDAGRAVVTTVEAVHHDRPRPRGPAPAEHPTNLGSATQTSRGGMLPCGRRHDGRERGHRETGR